MKHLVLLILLITGTASASGPVAPKGWGGSFSAELPNGTSCCLPADLNGTKLTGGAFVLISDDKSEFALFALTYSALLKEQWQLLERHPISTLSEFKFTIEPPGQFPHRAIKACTAIDKCVYWFMASPDAPMQRANNSFKPNLLRKST